MGNHFIVAIIVGLLCSDGRAIAQSIVPDGTLGPESSVVVPGVEIRGIDSDRIDGGARRGGNLFHSFQEFNVELNRGAYFSNPEGVDNILTRVTGVNLSNINGTLGILGGASLFLINPNGLVFGPGARLDLNGSFVGSTAEGILFEGFEFSTVDPNSPPLLTVNVPIGLQFGESPGEGEISVRSQPLELTGEEFAALAGDLQVAPGEALLLAGGEVSLEGRRLRAPGGRVELGGLVEAGVIGLSDNFSLSFPADVTRADISLLGAAEIDVTAGSEGSISIFGRNIDILDGSDICAGIGADSACGGLATDFGSFGVRAGDITLDAQEVITISEPVTEVNNNVNPGAVGNSGNINIRARSLFITNGARLDSSTSGQGDAGSINISASDEVFLSNGENDTFIFNNVLSGAVGSSEGIAIATGSLSVLNGAQIQSFTSGRGNSGRITIDARDTVSFDGLLSRALSNVGADGEGNSGGIDITTGSLSLTNGAQLLSNTSGQGNSGSINISASNEVLLEGGENNNTFIFNNVLSDVSDTIVDSAGITIATGSLSVLNGAQIQSAAFGQGNSGGVAIDARNTVSFDGQRNGFPSGAFSEVRVEGEGNSGGIDITTGSLSLTNGARLDSSTSGQGDAGSINISASDEVFLSNGENDTFIFNNVLSGAVGSSEGIAIATGSLSVLNGAQIQSFTSGRGNSGRITIDARDTVSFDGLLSRALSNVGADGEGNSGGIDITTGSLSLTNGAQLLSNTSGQGNSGSINISASNEVLLEGGENNNTFIFNNVLSDVSDTIVDSAGITIATGSLSVLNGAQIQSAAFGQGNSGGVAIDARNTVSFDGQRNGFPSGAFSEVRVEGEGNSGGIDITTGSLSLTNGARLDSSTSGQGDAGSINISASDEVFLSNGENDTFIFNNVLSGAVGSSEGIAIATGSLSVLNGAQIQSFTSGRGNSGRITIDARDTVSFDGLLSRALSNVGADGEGNSGGIDITTGSLSLTNGAQLLSNTSGQGNSGSINISASNEVLLEGGENNNTFIFNNVLSDVSDTIVDSAGITIATGSLSVLNGAQIQSAAFGQGNSGGVAIDARNTVSFDGQRNGFPSGAFSEVRVEGEGNSGGIDITTGSLSLTNGARLDSSTSGQGDAGSINISASDEVFLSNGENDTFIFNNVLSGAVGSSEGIAIATGSLSVLNGAQIQSFTSGRGNSGRITIDARDTVSFDGLLSRALSNVGADGEGNSGGIDITTGSLSLTNGARLDSSTSGQGDAGSINISANDEIFLADGVNDGFVFNNVLSGAIGDSEGITIATGSLSVLNGAQIQSSISGQGNSGGVTIDARDMVSFDGQRSGFPSGVFSSVEADGEGNSGGIDITTGSLSLTNGAQLSSSIFGQGSAGSISISASNGVFLVNGESDTFIFNNVLSDAVGDSQGITIATGSLSVLNGAQIQSSTFGKGNSGGVTIDARDTISFNGSFSSAFSNVELGGEGNSGGIDITTGSLLLTNGAPLNSSTFGKGNSGGVTIDARDTVSFNGFFSSAFSNVEPGGEGNSGGIDITTGSLLLTNGAQLSSSTFGKGNSGDITIQAPGADISLDGFLVDASGQPIFVDGKPIRSAIFSEVGESAVGRAGDIIIDANSLTLRNLANLSTETSGRGDAGNISVTVDEAIVLEGNREPSLTSFASFISTEVGPEARGQGGNIDITARSLTLRDGAEVDTSTSGGADEQGRPSNAGSITVNVEESLSLERGGLLRALTLGRGRGGDITIQAPNAAVSLDGFLVDDSGQPILVGNLPRSLFSEDSGLPLSSSVTSGVGDIAAGRGGNITINASSLTLKNSASLSTSTLGRGDAGNIFVTVNEAIVLEGNDGADFAFSAPTFISADVGPGARGQGGSVDITARSLALRDAAVRATNFFGITDEQGQPSNAGSITVNVEESLSLAEGAQLSTATSGQGSGGDIILNANTIDIQSAASIGAETTGSGDAGSVIVKADGAVILGQSTELTVETSAAGRPGAIEITAPVLTIGEDAQLSATVTPTATNPDGEGDITLNTTTLNVSGELGIFAETNSLAPAGNLTINPLGADPNLNILFTDNGFISTETTSSGDGGSIDIRAPQTLTIQGQGNITAQTSGGGPAGDITLSANTITLGDGLQITASTTDTSTGGSGSIFLLDAQTINLQNNATIAVDSQGSAPGGNIFIDANDLNLERGKISAETASTDGGNITINLENQLVLRDESAITTTAGTAQAGGNGGNIDIDSRFIIAFPSEGPAGNDIFANAFNGNGGSITIDTEGLLGIAFSEDLLFPQESSANDITVTSTFGLAGDFELVSPEVNPADALTSLPQRLVEVPIFGSCQVTSTNRGEDSIAFYELGRGGVPLNESPTREFGGVLGAWATLEEITTVRIIPPSPTAPSQTASAFRANLKHSSDGGSTHGPARFAPICRLF